MAIHTTFEERSAVTHFGKLATHSPKMAPVLARLSVAAAHDRPLLLEGETGVGKELAALSVHQASARRQGPFVVFDCAAQSAELGERELLGVEESNGEPESAGVFEQSARGTLLLDHIDELPPLLQVKLQRALERGELRRLGGRRAYPLDVRVITASTRSLRRQVRLGELRAELHELLGKESLKIPPLRERMEDLELLSEQLLQARLPSRTSADVAESVWNTFREYHWPGNVRELDNALQRVIMTPNRPLYFVR